MSYEDDQHWDVIEGKHTRGKFNPVFAVKDMQVMGCNSETVCWKSPLGLFQHTAFVQEYIKSRCALSCRRCLIVRVHIFIGGSTIAIRSGVKEKFAVVYWGIPKALPFWLPTGSRVDLNLFSTNA